MGKYFGTDGVRGVANSELTPELANMFLRQRPCNILRAVDFKFGVVLAIAQIRCIDKSEHQGESRQRRREKAEKRFDQNRRA